MSLGEFPIQIRKATDEDKAFVFATWKRSYHESRLMRWVDKNDYFRRMNGLCRRLLERSTCLLACNPIDDTHVFGWVVAERRPEAGMVAHYAYVRDNYRKLGIARRLFVAAGVTQEPIHTTHWVDICEVRNVVFRPSLLRE